MSKVFWNGGALLAPVPPALVSWAARRKIPMYLQLPGRELLIQSLL